jgi:hypothetical protein
MMAAPMTTISIEPTPEAASDLYARITSTSKVCEPKRYGH